MSLQDDAWIPKPVHWIIRWIASEPRIPGQQHDRNVDVGVQTGWQLTDEPSWEYDALGNPT
jgi:hypothetical protein